MPRRLKLPQIERRPKRIHVVTSWRDTIGIGKNPALVKSLLTIRRCIENGTPLPPGYYCRESTTSEDRLLDAEGIMHLHLGHSGTRELLFLIQYSDHVVFLEMSDHAHFANDPPGTQLRALHETKVVELEKRLAEAKQAEVEALRAKVRSNLKPTS